VVRHLLSRWVGGAGVVAGFVADWLAVGRNVGRRAAGLRRRTCAVCSDGWSGADEAVRGWRAAAVGALA
jgi:hypothetical protein